MEKIDRYEIKQQIGQGGMAYIYEAYDPKFNRNVAIKVVKKTQLGGREFAQDKAYERFYNEAQTIAQLEHYAILPIYDFGVTDGKPYMVMRLMQGGTLEELIAKGQLTTDQIDAILRRICSALGAAHAQKIIHRDLKPANILLDNEGMAYLSDFGIARLAEGTQTQSIMGTAHYMSPEQAQGEPLDPRSDVYQMGVILFEMLTGKQPYKGDNLSSLLYQHVHEPIPLLSDFSKDIPSHYEPVIQQAMAKKAQDRPQSAKALYQLFRQQATSSYTTRQISEPETLKQQDIESAIPFYKQSWFFVAAGLVSLALVLLPMFWSFSGGNSDTDETPTSIAREDSNGTGQDDTIIIVVSPTPDPSTEQISTPTAVPITPTMTPSPTVTPPAPASNEVGGGSGWLAMASNRTNNFDIYLVQIEPPYQEIQLTSDDANDFGPVWSPNGRQLAFHTYRDGNWEIYIMDENGQNKRNITRHNSDDAYPNWSADGQKLAFHSNRDGDFDLYLINIDGSGLRQLTQNDIDEFAPAWSPTNANQIAFHRLMGDKRQLFLMDLASGAETQLTFGSEEILFPRWSPDGNYLLFHIDNGNGSKSYFIDVREGNNMQAATNEINTNHFFPQWSPNGQYIAYHAQVSGLDNRQIYISDILNSTSNSIVLPDTGDNRMPSWQPVKEPNE